MLSTTAEIQEGQGMGSGYEWLAGLVFRVCMGGPNISGVQISHDRSRLSLEVAPNFRVLAT